MNYYRFLRLLLLWTSFGFYSLPIGAAECPGHPKSPEEIEQEDKRERRKKDPARELGDENQKEQYDKGNGDWASKPKQ